jgi:transcription termination factor NusB
MVKGIQPLSHILNSLLFDCVENTLVVSFVLSIHCSLSLSIISSISLNVKYNNTMDSVEDIETKVAELFQKSEDLNAELYTLGAMAERLEFFSKLRELIQEKESSNDQLASAVLGWAYERLAE